MPRRRRTSGRLGTLPPRALRPRTGAARRGTGGEGGRGRWALAAMRPRCPSPSLAFPCAPWPIMGASPPSAVESARSGPTLLEFSCGSRVAGVGRPANQAGAGSGRATPPLCPATQVRGTYPVAGPDPGRAARGREKKAGVSKSRAASPTLEPPPATYPVAAARRWGVSRVATFRKGDAMPVGFGGTRALP